MNTFNLTIKTPETTLFEGETVSIKLRAEGGQMQVLAKHASITATILFSDIVVETPQGEEVYVARRGVFAFDNKSNTAKLLCNTCSKVDQIDVTTAEAYLKFIEDKLAKNESLSDFQLTYLEGEKLAIEKQLQN